MRSKLALFLLINLIVSPAFSQKNVDYNKVHRECTVKTTWDEGRPRDEIKETYNVDNKLLSRETLGTEYYSKALRYNAEGLLVADSTFPTKKVKQDKFLYSYTDGKLTKKERYIDDEWYSGETYEYDSETGNLTKSRQTEGTGWERDRSTFEHTYSGPPSKKRVGRPKPWSIR